MLASSLGWALGVGCWMVGVNSLAVLAFYHDKRMAQLGGWRVSEQTLLAIALFGGSAGALVAREKFRHKTRKQPFSALLYAICGLQIVALFGMVTLWFTGLAAPWLLG